MALDRLCDNFGRPYIFFRLTRDVKKNDVGWTDYGDPFWEAWQSRESGSPAALSAASQALCMATTVRALLSGGAANNPIVIGEDGPGGLPALVAGSAIDLTVALASRNRKRLRNGGAVVNSGAPPSGPGLSPG